MTAPKTQPLIHSLILAADLGEVTRAREFLKDVAMETGFSEARVFDIQVACSEAISNAIEHAPEKGQVEVTTSLRPDRLEVEVEGPGRFQVPRRAQERSNRGLGLPLMACLADHLALYSGPRGGTLVSLTFYVPTAERDGDEGALPPSIMELIESNELVSSITENAPVGIYVLGPDLRFRWTNRVWKGFLDLSYRAVDLTGLFYGDVVPGAEDAGLVDILRCISEEGSWHTMEEFEFRGFERGVTYWRWDALPLKLERDEPPYDVLAVVSEVTEQVLQRRRVEALAGEIERERNRLRTILETSPAAVMIVDADGKVSYVNRRAQELYGFVTLGLDLNAHAAALKIMRLDGTPFPVEDMPATRSLRLGSSVRNVEMTIEPGDGRRFPVLMSSAPLFDAQGVVDGAIVIFDDLSGQKEAEEALQATNEELLRFNRAAVDRELRMVELKQEINALCAAAGQPRRYPLEFTTDQTRET